MAHAAASETSPAKCTAYSAPLSCASFDHVTPSPDKCTHPLTFSSYNRGPSLPHYQPVKLQASSFTRYVLSSPPRRTLRKARPIALRSTRRVRLLARSAAVVQLCHLLPSYMVFPKIRPQPVSASRPSLAVPPAAAIEDVTQGNPSSPSSRPMQNRPMILVMILLRN